MPDQPSGFTVTDRRKFTLDGDLREGASTAEETSEPAATAAQPQPEAKTEPKLGPQLVQNEPPVEKEVVSRNLEPLPAEDQPLDEASRTKSRTSFLLRPPPNPRSSTPTIRPPRRSSTT